MTGINEFAQLTGVITTRVEKFPLEGTKKHLFLREMNGSTTMELMKRSPNTIKRMDGQIETDNSTNNLDMGFVLSRCVVQADNHDKVLNRNAKDWAALPNRVLQPIFLKILDISDLGNDSEESPAEVGNVDEAS